MNMNYEKKYLKYKNKYLRLRRKINFNIMIGGYKSYFDALEEIFTKFSFHDENLSIRKTTERLEAILVENKVSPCHGIEHAKKVMYHAWCALEHYDISDDDKLSVLLAALLHDADDRKFFPENKNYENLRKILKDSGKSDECIENVVTMVKLVSASKNKDEVPEGFDDKQWMLVPRYADRIEAIGIVGVKRCHTYTKDVSKMPLYRDDTPRPTTEEEIWEYATEERYKRYSGDSKSMIDHYYDKLLRLSKFPIKNKYFDEECNKRRKPLIDFLIYFGNKGSITHKEVEDFIKDNSASISISDE